MTDIPIQRMVKCAMLYDHDPCDLVPATDCKTCEFKVHLWQDHVVCRYEP
jgi:hypothetical protein